jgi:maltose alpha-D-glucosyltransferase/alpha-amylase
MLCVNNLSKKPTAVELDLREYAEWTPIEAQTSVPFPKIGRLPYFFTLSPHTFFWFKLTPPTGDTW